jgi:hypothetical protein
MPYKGRLSGRFLRGIAALASAVALAACGSSVNTSTSPSTISKCVVAFDAPAAPLPAAGGTGAIPVKAERECTWTAEATDSWLSITGGRSGQGNGTVEFAVSANADPVARTAGIMLNGSRAQVAQAASECRYTLAANSTSLGQGGGTGSVDVRASSALCTWTAASNADWIAVTSGANGKGSATVSFTVAPSTGPPRSGTLTIAGLSFEVTQAEGCTYAVAPLTFAAGAAGATSAVTVTAPAGCPWTASSSVPWIAIMAGASGSGPGSVMFTVAPATGPSRTGTIVVAGQTVTIVQGEGCTFAISPETQSVPASGGEGSVSVTAPPGCAWTAASGAPWITIASGASGSGNGGVSFKVAATTGPARTGALTIAGRTFTVNQGADCTTALSPTSAAQAAGGGTGTFEVRTAQGCGWTAASHAAWLTLTAGTSGNGTGTVRYSAAANAGPQRTGTITAGGQTFTVTQDAGCSFAISPATHTASSSGGNVSVGVTAAAGCAWTAQSNVPWIGVSSGASGSGTGPVVLAIAANAGADRQGTVTIAGQTFTVQQGSGCAYTISPRELSVPSGGASGSFSVSTAGGCTWTAIANAAWLSVTSGGNGTGPGTVQFTVAANAGGARSGTITAGGQTYAVTQAAACSPVVAPEAIAAAAAGGPQNVSVTAAAECPWTAVSNAAWVAITAGPSGSGNGTVQLDVQPNAGPARSGTATIAGKTVGITQESGCTFSIAPLAHAATAAGGSGTVAVTAGSGCAWTAVSNAAWITVTKGQSGAGAGAVEFSVEANATGALRIGTITIAGHTFTVEQGGA